MNKCLVNEVTKLKSMTRKELAKKFGYKPEEVLIGDYTANRYEECPYKLITGFANFEDAKSLGKLEVVIGREMMDNSGRVMESIQHDPNYLGLTIKYSDIEDLGNLKKVYGSFTPNSVIKTLGDKLEFLGSNLLLFGTNIESFGNLRTILGSLFIEKGAKVTSLDKLETVHHVYINTPVVKSLGNLKQAQIECGYISQEVREELKSNFDCKHINYGVRTFILKEENEKTL